MRVAVRFFFSDFKALSRSQVGYKAVDDYVKSGMVVGLGTGSTAAFAVERAVVDRRVLHRRTGIV